MSLDYSKDTLASHRRSDAANPRSSTEPETDTCVVEDLPSARQCRTSTTSTELAVKCPDPDDTRYSDSGVGIYGRRESLQDTGQAVAREPPV
jgi:hypothetical protein